MSPHLALRAVCWRCGLEIRSYRHDVSQILPVEIDLVDVRLQRQIERERVVVDDAIFDVVQLTWYT